MSKDVDSLLKKHICKVVFTGITLLFLMGIVLLTGVRAAFSEEVPVLWNKLGSDEEVGDSQIGPGGVRMGTPLYTACKFDNGVHSASNKNYVTFPTSILLDKTKGTIEFWIKTDFGVIDGIAQTVEPNPYLVDSYSGHSSQNGVQIIFNKDAGIQFWYWANGAAKGVTDSISSWNAGDLIHIAAVWDKDGIDGTAETQQIYINGAKTTNAANSLGIPGEWSSIFACGSNWDGNNAMLSVMDNIKIFGAAKTDFSDRFYEGRSPILWNRLGSEQEITHSETGPDIEIFGNPIFEPAQFGNGVYFNSETEYLRTGSDILPLKEGCVEFWWKPDYDYDNHSKYYNCRFWGSSLGAPGPSPYGKSRPGGFYNYENSSFGIQVLFTDNSGSNYIFKNAPANPFYAGDLVHIAYVWDEDAQIEGEYSLAMYQNGELIGAWSDDIKPDIPLTCETPYLRICNFDGNTTSGWDGVKGSMDNFKIWDYAKTDFSDIYQEGQLLLWNKLGSDEEVFNSEIGPDGEMVGDIYYEFCHDENGFRSGIRTGDPDIPDNYIRFKDFELGPKGCIEFWYHPDWQTPSEIGFDTTLISYAKYNDSSVGFIQMEYNDWQNLLSCSARGNDVIGSAIEFAPSGQPGWSTTKPFHLAFTWDDAAVGQKVWVYINGEEVSGNHYMEDSTFLWADPLDLIVGSRAWEGDWHRHHWEPNTKGIIDDIKVWNYAKHDFSDIVVEENEPPVADDIDITTEEDIPVDIILTATDPENDELTYSIIDQPLKGTLTEPDGGSTTYTPNLNYNGVDSFTYIANDSELDSEIATVTINMDPVNDAPTATATFELNKRWVWVRYNIFFRYYRRELYYTFEGSGEDLDGEIVEYSWGSNLDGYLSSEDVFEINKDDLTSGGNIVTFKVKDNDGAWSEDVLLALEEPPVVASASIDPSKALEGETVIFDGSGEDRGGLITAYKWASDIDGALSDQASFSTDQLSVGQHSISFAVKDSEDLWSDEVSVIADIENQIPVVAEAAASLYKAYAGQIITFSGSGEDAVGDITEYVWSSDRDGFLSDSASFETYELSVGGHVISFKVKDDEGTWSKEYQMKLSVYEKTSNLKPTASASIELKSEVRSRVVGSWWFRRTIRWTVWYFEFTGSGNDEDGRITEYRWDSNLDGYISAQASFRREKSDMTVGENTITFKVKDNDGEWSDEVVLELYKKPVVSASASTLDAVEEQDIFFEGSAADVDGDIAEYRWTSSIDGVLSNESSFSTHELSLGKHLIVFTARDNDGLWSDPVSLTVTVTEKTAKNVEPTASASIEKKSYTVWIWTIMYYQFTGLGADSDGHITEYYWSSNIDGFLSNEASFTKSISWPGNRLSPGIHIITFKTKDNDGAWSKEFNIKLTVD